MRAQGQRQVQQGTLLQEVRLETGVGAEHEGALAVHVAGVQVGHRHGRCAHRSLTVHLSVVLVRGGLVGVAQEQAGDGETAVALTLFNTGLLQQVQGATTGTEEDELRVDGQRLFLVDAVNRVNGPGAVGFAV